MKLYAAISKIEDQEDGTLKVWGYASSGAVDSDGETVTPEAMKAALPDYMKFGAVREMHQPLAAGTAIEANVEDDGRTFFGAHVVDPLAIKKVKTEVYKGFSIGGKVTERDTADKKIIKGLKLVEVSLVDRPANPEAVFTMYKAARTPEDDVNEIAELLDAGTVTPAEMLALVKAAKNQELKADDATAKAAEADDLKKGLYDVADFACLLQCLSNFASGAQAEATYEGDDSPLPAALREWLNTGLGIFQAMAQEECAEMMTSLRAMAPAPVVDVMAAAGKTGDVAKAGAKFSATTKAALADIHKSMQSCCDKMDGLGYKQDDDDVESAANGADLAKLTGELDTLKGDLTKVSDERDALAKRVKELEAMPAPGKALLKAITKGDDVGDSQGLKKSAVEALPPSAKPEDIAKAQLIDMYRTTGVAR